MGELKRCVWCQAYKVTGDLPLRRTMSLNSLVSVDGGQVWRDRNGVLRFMCKKCFDSGMMKEISQFRRGFNES